MSTNIKHIEKATRYTFNNASVETVFIDEEFGCVTATVDGRKNTDCGFIEDIEKTIQKLDLSE